MSVVSEAAALESSAADGGAAVGRGDRDGLRRRELLAGGAGLAAAAMLSGPVSRALAASGPRIVVVGGGLAGLTCAYRLKRAGFRADLYEASDRLGGRCWSRRGDFAEGQIAEHGGELIDQGHTEVRQLTQELGLNLDNLLAAEVNGTEPFHYFDGQPYSFDEATDDLKQIWQQIHKDVSAASYPTLFDSSTQRGRELDAMSITDWIQAYVPGGTKSKLGQLLDVAYNIEYGAECNVQSSLNMLYLLGFSGQGQLRIFGPSNEKYHVRGGNDQISTRLAEALQSQINRNTALTAISRNSDGSYRLSFRSGESTSMVSADRVVLALPFSILRTVDYSKAGFEPLKNTAIQELGMGTNSKLHVQFKDRYWNGLGCQGETYADTGYQNTWEVTRAQPGAAGNPRRLHGRQDRRELRLRHTHGTGPEIPQTDRAGATGHLIALERPGDDRLLDRLRMDEGLLLLLEDRPVHEVRGHGAQTAGRLPFRRRAHLDRLPGLSERGRRIGRTRGERDPLRPQVARPEPVAGSEPPQQDVRVGDQAGGDHQQYRGDEDQGDDELDLGRGTGGTLLDRAALPATQGCRLARELIGKRRAEAA